VQEIEYLRRDRDDPRPRDATRAGQRRARALRRGSDWSA
jgi:hypothetical protein